MTNTRLDDAHADMSAFPDDDVKRLNFYERLADNELFLLLEQEAEGDKVSPKLFDTGQGRFALVFDREWRLTEFTGSTSPFASLSGRTIVSLLAPHDIGLGVNLDVAPSSMLVPPEAVRWLAETLSARPKEMSEVPSQVFAPGDIPESLIEAIDAKLSAAEGLADMALLTTVVWANGSRGHLLSLIAPLPGAEPALASAVSEALIFSGIEAGQLDVAFFKASDPITQKLIAVGLRFDIPKVDVGLKPMAPGMDPDNPPKLV